jgi:hypothetical protein
MTALDPETFFAELQKALSESDEATDLWRETNLRRAEWTRVMTEALARAAEATLSGMVSKLLVTAKGRVNSYGRSEYFSLDLSASDDESWGSPLLIAEHENDRDDEKLTYCTWKLLCVEAQLRILVAYVDSERQWSSYRSDEELAERLRQILNAHPTKSLVLITGNLRIGVEDRDWRSVFTMRIVRRRGPVSYSDFSIEDVKARFNLQLDEKQDLFGTVSPVDISPLLRETLVENVPLALAISTEKARSELIIAPVLLEARRQVKRSTSLFSGVDFTVDPERGLKGVCDFLLGLSAEQLTIEAPVITVVEAKNENMKAGIGQCLAEMVGARLFNERKGQPLPVVYGIVTTGNNWKFLRLVADTGYIDLAEYHIKEVARVVGIIAQMLKGEPV